MPSIELAKHDIEGATIALQKVPDDDIQEIQEVLPISRKTQLKVDARIILTIGLVYSLSVIDRINIGQVG